MTSGGAWVRRYLHLLGVEHPAPSVEALARLTRAHLRVVPFENVTALLRRRAHPDGPVPPVDPEALLTAWEAGRGGGVCFEVAELCGRLLGALGYRVQHTLGDISFPGSHQALVVELAGGRWLVDVANGAPFFEPIPLGGAFEVRRAGLAYRFRGDGRDGTWLQERLLEGAWAPFCRYALDPPSAAQRLAAYQRHHAPGESWVTGSPLLIRCLEDEVLLLRDGELTRFTAAGKRTLAVPDPAARVRLAGEVFGLPGLPLAEGLEAWRELARRAAPR